MVDGDGATATGKELNCAVLRRGRGTRENKWPFYILIYFFPPLTKLLLIHQQGDLYYPARTCQLNGGTFLHLQIQSKCPCSLPN